jgi:hypothetical protein
VASGRRGGFRWSPGGGGEGVDEVVLHGRVDGRLAADDRLQGLADLLGAGVLGQVAAGTGPQGLHHRALVVSMPPSS